jgi:hypothetical protein
MRTNKIGSDFNYRAYRFNNCLAYEQYDDEKGVYTYIVFTDISYRRFKASNRSWKDELQPVRRGKYHKILFMTNKQLMDMTHPLADYHFMKDVRALVFDAKLGTRYEAKRQRSTSTGSYFWCLSSDTIEMKSYPKKRVRQS